MLGQAVDIVYLDISKTFYMVSNSFLQKTLIHYSIDKWSMQ